MARRSVEELIQPAYQYMVHFHNFTEGKIDGGGKCLVRASSLEEAKEYIEVTFKNRGREISVTSVESALSHDLTYKDFERLLESLSDQEKLLITKWIIDSMVHETGESE